MLFECCLNFSPSIFQIEADFAQMKGNCGATFLGSFEVLYLNAILSFLEQFALKVNNMLSAFGNSKSVCSYFRSIHF